MNTLTQETQETQDAPAMMTLEGARPIQAEEADQTSIDVKLPSALVYDTAFNGFCVQLFAEACLDCPHLRTNTLASESEYPCHISAGNTNCPADGKLVFQITGKRVSFKARLEKALESKDNVRFARLLAKAQEELDTQDFDWLVAQVVATPSGI